MVQLRQSVMEVAGVVVVEAVAEEAAEARHRSARTTITTITTTGTRRPPTPVPTWDTTRTSSRRTSRRRSRRPTITINHPLATRLRRLPWTTSTTRIHRRSTACTKAHRPPLPRTTTISWPWPRCPSASGTTPFAGRTQTPYTWWVKFIITTPYQICLPWKKELPCLTMVFKGLCVGNFEA